MKKDIKFKRLNSWNNFAYVAIYLIVFLPEVTHQVLLRFELCFNKNLIHLLFVLVGPILKWERI